jgi:cell division ATPase FtsA
MERIGALVQGRILPTPGAVLLAAEKLAEELGDLVVVDVGGATTDVHSVTEGSPELAARHVDPQPHAKRTVEGDLGTFVSAEHVLESIAPALRPAALPPALPVTEAEAAAAAALARQAAAVALRRHAGELVSYFTATGRTTVARGRDLTACRLVIGTGGALTRLPGGAEILAAALAGDRADRLMPPIDARCLLDRDYIFACAGALLGSFPAARVVALMRASLGV